MVPEGWRRVEIGHVGDVVTGSTPATNNPAYYEGGDIPFISPGDLGNGVEITEAAKAITQAGLDKVRSVPAGSTLFVCIGSTIGKIGLATRQVATNQQINAVVPSKENDPRFIFYAIALRAKHIARLAGNQAVPIINKSQFSGELIDVPPLAEQNRIAEVLGVWDRAIAVAGQQLDLARTQKRALMQTLLTPTRRFPGFDGQPWKEVRLGDVGNFRKGKGIPKTEVSSSGRFPCVLYGELYTRYGEVIHTPVSATDLDDGVPSVTGDVLIPASTTTSGIDLAIASCVTQSGVRLGGDINIFRPDKSRVDGRFLAYVLTNIKRQEIAQFAQGITIVHLKGSDLVGIGLSIPSLEEQGKIVEALRVSETEITTLETQISRLQAEKKALMQQLLTGKKRLAV